MKSKRRILEEAVIEAALDAADAYDRLEAPNSDLATRSQAWAAFDRLSITTAEYAALSPTPVSGAGAPWAEGSDTSRQAAKLAWPTQNSTRLAIVALLANVTGLARPGYTDRQLEARLRRSHQTVSSARNWLCQAGWVEDSGIRRSFNGRPACVWQLTEAAHQALKEGKQ